jgi:hypothetical protein
VCTFLAHIRSLDGHARVLAGERIADQILGQLCEAATATVGVCFLDLVVFIFGRFLSSIPSLRLSGCRCIVFWGLWLLAEYT